MKGWLVLALAGCAAPDPVLAPAAWSPGEVLLAGIERNDAEGLLEDEDGLSPDEAAVVAVEKNPRLVALRAERGIARAEILTAGLLPNPRLAASLEVPFSGPGDTALGYGGELSWNVTPLLSRTARVEAAERRLASVALDVAWQEWQVAQAARLHAVRVISLTRRERVARDLEHLWRTRLDGLRNARRAGAVTTLQVASAEVSRAKAEVRRLDLSRRLVRARADLHRALGLDAAIEVRLDASFSSTIAVPDRDQLLALLPERRLDLLGLRQAEQSRDAALKTEVISRFPPVEIGFGVRRDVDGVDAIGVGLAVDLPFFDQNQGPVALSAARKDRVAAEYAARLLEARTDVVRGVAELAIVKEQVASARAAAGASTRLTEEVRAAMVRGALSPLLGADVIDRLYTTRLRAIEIEQTAVELVIGIALASGIDAPVARRAPTAVRRK